MTDSAWRAVGPSSAATEMAMKRQPGFISANIQKSIDGTVVNYAQWRSEKDFAKTLKNPEAGQHMKQPAARAKHEPHLYSVNAIHAA
jgi:heme-degrading monooxygenase HmoA